MTEVKIYGALLLALLVGAYMTWTAEDQSASSERVVLFDAEAPLIERIDFFTKTQTVAFSYRERDGDRYPWFEVENNARTRTFVGNEETEKLVQQFAPFEALRSLGDELSEEELSATKLDNPERRLVIKARSREKSFDVGGRTNGARDHYVRAAKTTEVLLVASKTLTDIQFPDGKYMQRKLRVAPLKEVARVVIQASGKNQTALQKNRLSPTDAFWAKEAQPDEANETIKTFITQVEKLTAGEYLSDESPWNAAEPILTVEWFDEDGESIGSAAVARQGTGKSAKYYARSRATRLPVQLSRFTAEALEKDLPSLFD